VAAASTTQQGLRGRAAAASEARRHAHRLQLMASQRASRFSARDTFSVSVGRVVDIHITQQQDTELYIYLYVSCICLRIYLHVYMWHIHRCVFTDATAGTSDGGGLSNVWCKEADQTHDHTGGLSPDPY